MMMEAQVPKSLCGHAQNKIDFKNLKTDVYNLREMHFSIE